MKSASDRRCLAVERERAVGRAVVQRLDLGVDPVAAERDLMVALDESTSLSSASCPDRSSPGLVPPLPTAKPLPVTLMPIRQERAVDLCCRGRSQ